MARQLFPELAETGGQWPGYYVGTVARRAGLIYWWDVEPGERAALAERVRAMKKQGESNRTIAAVLKISDAKVKQALDEDAST